MRVLCYNFLKICNQNIFFNLQGDSSISPFSLYCNVQNQVIKKYSQFSTWKRDECEHSHHPDNAHANAKFFNKKKERENQSVMNSVHVVECESDFDS